MITSGVTKTPRYVIVGFKPGNNPDVHVNDSQFFLREILNMMLQIKSSKLQKLAFNRSNYNLIMLIIPTSPSV